jgi:hypothetical protein
MKQEKGSAIFLTVVMVSVFLAVVLGLTSIIVGGAKITQSFGNSVNAFHAADTGMEQALYRIRQEGNCNDFTGTIETNLTFSVAITHTGGGTCEDPGTSIKSTGTYMDTHREVETNY